MLSKGHIFTIKTKDPENVSRIQSGDNDVVISGLNVLKDQIEVGDFVFVVFGGDKPRGWTPGLVALAHISKAPFDEGYAGDRNFRVKIDVDLYLSQSIVRKDLVTYPATFDTIGIGPITRWEPNQAITAVDRKNAIALLQAICDICPTHIERIKEIVGELFEEIDKPIPRYALAYSPLGRPTEVAVVDGLKDSDVLGGEFEEWMMRVAGKSQKTAKDTARVYVPSISDELQEPTKSIWHGLREVLYGAPAPKSVYALENVSELNEYYAGIGKLFAKSYDSTGYDDDRFKKCWDWVHSSENHNSIRAGWALFTRFMQWRESHETGLESCQNIDVWAVVLKLFKEKRTIWTSSFIGEGAVYASVNTEVRNYFGDAANWNVETLAGAEAFKEFCIKHTWMLKNGNGAWASLSTYTDEQRKELLAWIDSRIVKQEKPLSEVVVDDNGFKGLTNKAVTELLMKFHPGQYCLCNGPTLEALKTLKLIGDGVSEKFAYNDYMQVMGACANVLARLKSANIHATADGTDNPDYIVVNEFLYFVSENFKEIKGEVIKMAAKPAERNPYDKTKTKKKTFNADSKEDQLMLRILASLRTKPFVILAGHSGTGKSRMVKKLAYMTCRDNKLHEGSDPGNYCIIEVKPNWHDSTELLGYFSSFGHDHYVTKQLVEFIMKAYAYPDVPFFVCLDEMNLAPVEQYFAEFLSALEDIHVDEGKMNEFFGLNAANKPEGSAAQEVVKYTSAPLIKPIDYKDDIAMLEPKTTQAMDWLKTHGLTIPKNLFVVGTVNVDESTNQFSRKVLDRAFTIEMTDARFEDFGDEDKDPMPTFAKEDEIDHALIDNLLMGKKQAGKLSTRGTDANQPKGQLENMNDLKGVLAGTPFVVAYRFANEYALYEDALNVLDVLADGASDEVKTAKKAANAKRAFDEAVLMKLLPRIAGERAVVAEIFEGRKATDKRGEKDGLLKFLEYDKEQEKGTASGEKMTEILNRGNVPYLTFWP